MDDLTTLTDDEARDLYERLRRLEHPIFDQEDH